MCERTSARGCACVYSLCLEKFQLMRLMKEGIVAIENVQIYGKGFGNRLHSKDIRIFKKDICLTIMSLIPGAVHLKQNQIIVS